MLQAVKSLIIGHSLTDGWTDRVVCLNVYRAVQLNTSTVLYTLWTRQVNRSDRHKGSDARPRVFLNIFAWDIWKHVLSWGQMFDFNCGTACVEAIISITFLTFISTFYNNVLYVLMHICFYDAQHCILVISRN